MKTSVQSVENLGVFNSELCYEIFGYDMLINNKGRVFILEVNNNVGINKNDIN